MTSMPSMRRFHLVYGVGLALVAFVSITAWFILERAILLQAEHGRVINIAGRQRMLSQRIPMLSSTPTAELEQAIATMARANDALLRSPPTSPVQELLTPETAAGTEALAGDVEAFLEAARNDSPDLRDRAEALLPRLDQFVKALENEAAVKTQALAHTETLLLIFTLVLLVLEGVVLFRPLMRSLGAALAEAHAERIHALAEERRLTQVLDTMDEAVVLLDERGSVQRFRSRAFREQLEGAEGQTLRDVFGAEIRLPDLSGNESCVTDARRGSRSYRVDARPFVTEEEAGYLAVIRDVTDAEDKARSRALEAAKIRAFLGDPELVEEALGELQGMLEALRRQPEDAGQVLFRFEATARSYGFSELSSVARRGQERLVRTARLDGWMLDELDGVLDVFAADLSEDALPPAVPSPNPLGGIQAVASG